MKHRLYATRAAARSFAWRPFWAFFSAFVVGFALIAAPAAAQNGDGEETEDGGGTITQAAEGTALADAPGEDGRNVIYDALAAPIMALESAVFTQVPIFGANVEIIVLFALSGMLFFTVYLGFINFRGFRTSIDVIRGKYRNESDPGEVSQFAALSTALSGTVGLGNIAGVAIAIALGGPGATFWMILIGLAAMSLKFAEVTLAVKYRDVHEDGTVSGGPMYYLKKGLTANGRPRLGVILGTAYAIFGICTLPQFLQVNQAYSQVSGVTGLEGDGFALVFGIGFAVLVAAVIIGGIKEIAAVTAKLVPAMIVIYMTSAILILIVNAGALPAAIATIVTSAFAPEAVAGGVIGVIIIGMRRAVYSSEAGLGTATIAHSAAKTNEPVSEGMVALLEPFIDTVVVCTITALVIVVTGAYLAEGADDIQMTSEAFASVFSWFPWVLALAVFLFAFSTVISWGYYLEKIWTYLLPDTWTSRNVYRAIYCVLLIPGPSLAPALAVAFLDSVFFLLLFPNILGLFFLAPEIKRDLQSYLARLKSGEIPPAADWLDKKGRNTAHGRPAE